jgi:opacity protein-like surface antigen
MKKTVLSLGIVAILIWAVSVCAQGPTTRKFEIVPFGGGAWSNGYDVLLGSQKGTIATRGSAMWGIALDYSIRDSLTQIEASYNRQDTKLTYQFGGEETDVADVSIEYLQLGGLFGVEKSNVVWFTSLSLGTTRFVPKEGTTEDEWRFSMIFGLGAKYYFNDRVGLRLQGCAPYMFVEDETNYACGDLGCLKSAGGRGFWQFEVSLGLTVRL